MVSPGGLLYGVIVIFGHWQGSTERRQHTVSWFFCVDTALAEKVTNNANKIDDIFENIDRIVPFILAHVSDSMY